METFVLQIVSNAPNQADPLTHRSSEGPTAQEGSKFAEAEPLNLNYRLKCKLPSEKIGYSRKKSIFAFSGCIHPTASLRKDEGK